MAMPTVRRRAREGRCNGMKGPDSGADDSGDERRGWNRVSLRPRPVASDRLPGPGHRCGGGRRCDRHQTVARDDGLRYAPGRLRHPGPGEAPGQRPVQVGAELRVDRRFGATDAVGGDRHRSHDRLDRRTNRPHRRETYPARIGDRRSRGCGRRPHPVDDRLAAYRDGGPAAPALVAAGGAPGRTRPAGTAAPHAVDWQGAVSAGRRCASHHGVGRHRVGQDRAGRGPAAASPGARRALHRSRP